MSTRYNTGNPIESTDVRDMSDNAKNFDEFSNSTSDSFTDRLGRDRQTIEGAIRKAGFRPASFDFVTGGTLVSGDRNKAVFNPAPSGDNNWYAWQGAFPKIVAPNSTPATSGGLGDNAWKPVTNNIIAPTVRESIRRSYADEGYNVVGTFQRGFLLVNTNDVGIDEATGKGYTGPAGSVPAGTDPTGGGFVDVSRSTRVTISPLMFGAVGDGVVDDSDAVNSAFDFLRQQMSSTSVSFDINGGGLTYRCTKPINATLLTSWGWAINDLAIYSEAAGKIAIEMTGSRGGRWEGLLVVGSKDHSPAIGIAVARGVIPGSLFCDNTSYRDCTVEGYFTSCAAYFYGQETSTYDHCRFWNSSRTGRAAIHTGQSLFVMPWTYVEPTTGPQSFINNKYSNMDYRYAAEFVEDVIAVSKTNPCVITLSSNRFNVGDYVCTWLINSIPALTNRYYQISAVNGNQITLAGVDGTAFPTFSGSGFIVPAQEQPTVYLGRGEQHHFDTSYIVAFGAPNLQFDFADQYHRPRSIWLDVLFEGAASPCHVAFTNVGTPKEIYDFKLSTYNAHSLYSIMQSDGPSNGVVFYGFDVTAQNVSVPNAVTLFDADTKFGIFDADLSLINTGMFNADGFAGSLVGKVSYLDGSTRYYNVKLGSSGDGSYTPTVTVQAGALGSYTVTGSSKAIGDLVFFSVSIVVANNGTASGDVKFTLPYNATVAATFAGRETATSGKMLQGFCAANSKIVVVRDVANAYPIGSSGTIIISGCYAR